MTRQIGPLLRMWNLIRAGFFSPADNAGFVETCYHESSADAAYVTEGANSEEAVKRFGLQAAARTSESRYLKYCNF